jgi:hypothetical protein
MWDRETKKWSVLSHPIPSHALHFIRPINRPMLLLRYSKTNRCETTDKTRIFCSGLVDFEMWDPYPESNKPDPNDLSKDPSAEESLTELRKWGLAHKPPAKNWWAEFGIVTA